MERAPALAAFRPGDRVQYAYLGTAGVVVGLDEASGRVVVELESVGERALSVAMAPALLTPDTKGPGSLN